MSFHSLFYHVLSIPRLCCFNGSYFALAKCVISSFWSGERVLAQLWLATLSFCVDWVWLLPILEYNCRIQIHNLWNWPPTQIFQVQITVGLVQKWSIPQNEWFNTKKSNGCTSTSTVPHLAYTKVSFQPSGWSIPTTGTCCLWSWPPERYTLDPRRLRRYAKLDWTHHFKVWNRQQNHGGSVFLSNLRATQEWRFNGGKTSCKNVACLNQSKKTDQGYQFGTTSDQMLATSNEDSGPALMPLEKTLGLWAGSRPFRSNPILAVEYSSSSSPPPTTTIIIIPSYHDFFQQYSYIWIKYMIH